MSERSLGNILVYADLSAGMETEWNEFVEKVQNLAAESGNQELRDELNRLPTISGDSYFNLQDADQLLVYRGY